MKITLLLCQFILAGLGLYAQPTAEPAALLSSSGSGSASTFSASWVLGDAFSSEAVLTFETTKTDDDLLWMVAEVKLIGNPVNEAIRLESTLSEQLYFQLINLQGQLLSEGDIHPGETLIPAKNLPTQLYFLVLFAPDGRYLTSFKITKIN